MEKKRLVIIDGHIVAQYHHVDTGWWTYELPGNKYAVWEDTRENRFQARSRFGRMPVVQCGLKPIAPRETRFYGDELRKLARSI